MNSSCCYLYTNNHSCRPKRCYSESTIRSELQLLGFGYGFTAKLNETIGKLTPVYTKKWIWKQFQEFSTSRRSRKTPPFSNIMQAK